MRPCDNVGNPLEMDEVSLDLLLIATGLLRRGEQLAAREDS